MRPTILAILALLILASTAAFAAEPFPPLDATLLDPATFAERIGSAPESLVRGEAHTAKLGPKAVVWCKQAKPHWCNRFAERKHRIPTSGGLRFSFLRVTPSPAVQLVGCWETRYKISSGGAQKGF